MIRLTDRLRALGFLTRVLVRPDRRPGATVRLAGTVADVVRPRRGASWGTVVVVHGLTPNGRRDPRVVSACRALAAVGLEAVAPDVPALKEMRLDATTSDHLAAIVRVCADRRPVGIVAASFAAGMAIRAAAREDVARRVAGLLLVGTYVDARALLAHLFAPGADPYGRDILVAALGATTPEAVLATRGAEVDAMSALSALQRLLAPVALLHGVADTVIPPTESMLAAEVLAARGIPCRLATTSLLDHGTPGSPWTRPRDVAEVADVTASWFAAVRHAGRKVVRISAIHATAHQVASSTTNGQ